MSHYVHRLTVQTVLLAGLLPAFAGAQEVRELNLTGVPPDLISPTAAPSAALAAGGITPVQTQSAPPVQQDSMIARTQTASVTGLPGGTGSTGNAAQASPPAPSALDLGQSQTLAGPAPGAVQSGAVALPAPGLAGRAALAARSRNANPGLRRAVADTAAGPAERAVFERAPVRVPLPVGRERLVTLPAAAALHVPNDMEQVARIQNIDRTLYVTALTAFTPIRILAELLDTGQRIPLDLVADKSTAASTGELQVSVIDPQGGGAASSAPALAAERAGQTESASDASGAPPAGLDMVELTRYAARQLYAPERLTGRQAGVTQIAVVQTPVPSLIRGVNAEIVPLGAWKSGPLVVTALRVSNRSRFALEIPLEQLRGHWIAATAQHGRIGPAGSDTDTTAIYLISSRPFEASL